MEGYGDWVEGNTQLIRTKKSEIIQLCKIVQVDGQARCVTCDILTPAALSERLADFPLQVRTQRSDMVCCSIIRDLKRAQPGRRRGYILDRSQEGVFHLSENFSLT